MRNTLLLSLCFFAILVESCDQQSENVDSESGNFVFFLPDSIDTDHEHFPILQLKTSALFQEIGEPNLKTYQGEKEIYRLSYNRSFSIFDDVVYRLEIDRDSVTIHVNAGSGEIPEAVLEQYNIPQGIFHPTDRHTTSHFSTVRIKPEEVVDSLRLMLQNFDFWNQPIKIDFQGEDGDNYILEGYRNGKYHAIYRWNPVKGSEEYVIRKVHQLFYNQLHKSVMNPELLTGNKITE